MSFYTLEKDSKTLIEQETIRDPNIVNGISAILNSAQANEIFIMDTDNNLMLPYFGQFYKNTYYIVGTDLVRILNDTNNQTK